MNPRIEHIEREDLVMFLNACFAATGQAEFYTGAGEQRVSIGFLHAYIHGNYPRLYPLCLAAGINDYNKAEIVARLLAAGAPGDPAERCAQGELIAAALATMPPQRVYRLFERLRKQRVNNRRTRAMIRDFLRGRDPAFDAIKYGKHLRSMSRHAHLDMTRVTGDAEIGPFLFAGAHSRKQWDTPLLDTFRRARYEQAAIYELPYTVAEGLAQRHGISRKRFLERIGDRMTATERQRLEQSARRHQARLDPLELDRMPLTRLALYVLSRPRTERAAEREVLEHALDRAAQRASQRLHLGHAHVCAVLDCSFSSRGSAQKPNRPLAVTLGAHTLLRRAARSYRAFFTAPVNDALMLEPRGQTDLATPLLRALACQPDIVVIVSDGLENDPPGAVAEIIRIYRKTIDTEHRTTILHLNPVFDSREYMPRSLSPEVPALGVRDAEDMPTALQVARFASGAADLAELEDYLRQRADALIHLAQARRRRERNELAPAQEHAP